MILSFSDVLKQIDVKDYKRENDLKTDAYLYCTKTGLPVSLINLVALRFSIKNITVYQVTKPVINKISTTSILNIPAEIPKLLKDSFIIETRENEPLLKNVTSISGYWNEGSLFLLMQTTEGDLSTQNIQNPFEQKTVKDIDFFFTTDYTDSANDTSFFRFALIFAILLKAEKTPIVSKNQKTKINIRTVEKKSEWMYQRIYLDKKYTSSSNNSLHEVLDKNGKVKKTVEISGFLRYQHYGAKNSLGKYIYIESFESSRWIKEGDRKIVIG